MSVKKQIFKIGEIAVCQIEVSENPDPQGRTEENLYIFGPAALQNVRDRYEWLLPHLVRTFPVAAESKMSFMMFCLPALSEIYGIHRHDLQREWVRHYGLWLAALNPNG